jgi:VanZ family protein
MRTLAYLAIATFYSISALVSLRKPWFGFIYTFPGGDKFAHFVGPGLLSFFIVLGFSSPATSGRPRAPIACLAAAALLVTLDEVIQLAIPSRAFEWKDLAWSLTGVLVFGLLATAVQWIGRRRRVN